MAKPKNTINAAEAAAQRPAPSFLSSQSLHWPGLVVEQLRLPAMEHIIPPLLDHTVILVLKRPVQMIQRRDAQHSDRTVMPGDSILAPARQASACRWSTALSMLSLRLTHATLQSVAGSIASADATTLELRNTFGTPDPHLSYLGRALQAELWSGGLEGQLYVESLTQLLAVHLLRHYSNKAPMAVPCVGPLSQEQLRRARDYINDTLHEQCSLPDIAAAVAMSPYHFARGFKQATGLAPHQYVIGQRIERAKLLLLTSSLSAADVAVSVGFYDQSHMARHMQRYFGVSPKIIQASKKLR